MCKFIIGCLLWYSTFNYFYHLTFLFSASNTFNGFSVQIILLNIFKIL